MEKKLFFTTLLIVILSGCGKKQPHTIYEGLPVAADTFAGRITAIDCDPLNENIALGFSDSLVIIWNPVKRESVSEIRKHKHIINDVAISPDGNLLAIACGDEVFTLNDLNNNATIDSVTMMEGAVTGIDFSSDGKYLAASFSDSKVYVWDVPDWELFGEFNGHQDVVTKIRFRPGTDVLYSAARDSFFFMADVEDSTSYKTKEMHGFITAIAFSSDGNLCATGGTDQLVKVWRVWHQWGYDSLTSLGWYQNDMSRIMDICFAPNDSMFVAVDQEGQVVFLTRSEPVDTAEEKGIEAGVFRLRIVELGRFKGHPAAIRVCAFSDDGRWLYTGGDDKVLKTWDVEDILFEFSKQSQN